MFGVLEGLVMKRGLGLRKNPLQPGDLTVLGGQLDLVLLSHGRDLGV
jgi:hypothetical protein